MSDAPKQLADKLEAAESNDTSGNKSAASIETNPQLEQPSIAEIVGLGKIARPGMAEHNSKDITSDADLQAESNVGSKSETADVKGDNQSSKHNKSQITEGTTSDAMQTITDTIPNSGKEHGKTGKQDNASDLILENAEESDEDDEGICLGDGSDLDIEGRNKLFEKGLSFERNGKRNKALKCYLACLNSLKPESKFPLLPQCLRNIADIFYQKEEYDKAVHFIQAEKLFYESALIDTTDIQLKLEEAQSKEGSLTPNMTTDTVRASEYEHLARLCLDKGQPQLALEYAGKATKLRQQVLGDKDPVTIESLDFFASVYAKVGAEQYEESLKKFTDKSADGDTTEGLPNGGSGDQKEPVSILRKRKNSEKEKKVHFDESQLQSHEHMQNEENCAKSVLWALLVICSVLLIILGIYLYCNLTGSLQCTKFRADLQYAYMRLKYWYYQYQGGPNAKFM